MIFNSYGSPTRDERKHVISVIFEVEVDDLSTLKAGDDASTASFVSFKELINHPDKFAFDHYQILTDFLRSKENLKSLL